MLETITEGLTKILQHIWQAIFVVPFDYWGDFLKEVLKTASDFYGERIADAASSLLNALSNDENLSSEAKAVMNNMLMDGRWTSILAAFFYLIPWLSGYVLNTYGVMNTEALRDVYSTYTPSLPDIIQLVTLMHRDKGNESEWRKIAAWLGFDDDHFDNVIDATKPILDPSELMQLVHRGKIDDGEFKEKMSHWGYNDNDIENIYELGWYIPNVPDLIRMAVREVFTPDIAERFGLFQDFPADVAVHAQKHGLTTEWAKRFWAAHWELPSLQMGYEMLHRGVIEQKDLDLLLRAQDVMPFWRDKLTKISYRPLTRVDVRRMYAFGVLDEKAVFKAYKDVGYNDENALSMTEFTVKWVVGKEKDLSKTELVDSLKKGIIDESDCKEGLKKLGYDTEEVQILIDRGLYEKEEEKKALSISNIKALFINNVYSLQKASDKLAELNLSGSEADDLIELWEIEKPGKIKRIGLRDLIEMYKTQIINKKEFIAELEDMNYTDQSVMWVTNWADGITFDERK